MFRLPERVAYALPFLHVVNNWSTKGDRFSGSSFLTIILWYNFKSNVVQLLRSHRNCTTYRSIDAPSPPVTKRSRLVDPPPIVGHVNGCPLKGLQWRVLLNMCRPFGALEEGRRSQIFIKGLDSWADTQTNWNNFRQFNIFSSVFKCC